MICVMWFLVLVVSVNWLVIVLVVLVYGCWMVCFFCLVFLFGGCCCLCCGFGCVVWWVCCVMMCWLCCVGVSG